MNVSRYSNIVSQVLLIMYCAHLYRKIQTLNACEFNGTSRNYPLWNDKLWFPKDSSIDHGNCCGLPITPHTIFLRHLMVVVSNAHLYIYVTRQIALGVRHVLIFLLLLFDCLMWKYSEKKEVVVSYSNCLNPLLALCDTKATATIYTAKIP